VANAGGGIVFLDLDDDDAERRFTLAHEVSHFVLDHHLPRLRALAAFGETILPVLDGQRPPTREEALSAALDHVSLGVHVHLMGRGPQGAICDWSVEDAEQRADRLALELLAPACAATQAVRQLLGARSDDPGKAPDQAAGILASRFGLPARIARSYFDLLTSRSRVRSTLTDEILGSS